MAAWKGGSPIKQVSTTDCWCLLGVPELIALIKARRRQREELEEELAWSGFLRKPKLDKDCYDAVGDDTSVLAGRCTMQGWRSGLEDDDCCLSGFDGDPHAGLFAIFDGHAGRAVANFAAATFPQTFRRNEAYHSGDYLNALAQSFHHTDDMMLRDWPRCFTKLSGWRASAAESIDPDPCGRLAPGSTSVVAFIKQRRLYIANAGDCRAVLCRAGMAVQLTTDHDPYLPEELLRIEEAGCMVLEGRVNGILAMSRALGDFQFKAAHLPPEKQAVTSQPELIVRDIDDADEFLVLGCDGVWERWRNEKIIEFVHDHLQRERRKRKGDRKLSSIAAALLSEVVAPNIDGSNGLGLDNMTCIIIDLRA